MKRNHGIIGKDQKTTNEIVEFDIDQERTSYQALIKYFTNYQVEQARFERKETAKKEVRFDNVAKSIKKNEQRIYHVEKTLPEKIRKVVGHIEFARPLDKK